MFITPFGCGKFELQIECGIAGKNSIGEFCFYGKREGKRKA